MTQFSQIAVLVFDGFESLDAFGAELAADVAETLEHDRRGPVHVAD